ncbi:MAG: hypothetical protein AAGD05_07660, partial [Bacteroidota bacterium]
ADGGLEYHRIIKFSDHQNPMEYLNLRFGFVPTTYAIDTIWDIRANTVSSFQYEFDDEGRIIATYGIDPADQPVKLYDMVYTCE